MNHLLILGTDTLVGKSTIALALCKALSRLSPVRYWKPVETGKGNWDSDKAAQFLDPSLILPPSYRLTAPLSPHLAAEYDGIRIDRAKIERDLDRHLSSNDRLVVEGVGGPLVPLTEELFFADLVSDWPVSVVLVVHDRLGAINQTLLSLEACRRRELDVIGIIYNRHEEEFGNEESLAKITKVPTLGVFPNYDSETTAIEKISSSEEIQSLSQLFSSKEVS